MTSIDVRKVRADLKMTQAEFCARFGFPLGTLRHWEQGVRSPAGPARVLLMVIRAAPEAVIQAVAAGHPKAA